MTPQQILARHDAALARRRPHESNWRDAYAHVLPAPNEAATLYDATAADAAEQLGASLLAELTPPWSRWFGLAPAHGLTEPAEAAALEQTAETLQSHLDRSNFAVEMHQAFLDLVITGTGIMLVEEAPPGEATALRFTAVPVRTAVLEEGPAGRLDTVFRETRLSTAAMLRRFPFAEIPAAMQREAAAEADEAEPLRHRLIEAVWPDGQGHRYAAVFDAPGLKAPIFVAQGRFADAPFIAFRWLKAPGEVYGRGPVIKALPDIRTANRVVELVLKNASIAVTGIWQAEDDGVLNPATVQLTPGAIIPKAPGSAGLTPLAAPGDFDVSQLVLNDLRARIRTALLADRLGALRDQRMTATEVLERSAETARLLGATYGRLQSELLTPLVARSLAILARRGEVPPVLLDQGRVALRYESPLARVQGRADAANTLLFLDAVSKMGAAAVAEVDAAAAARWLARTLGAPAEILAPSVQPE
ncbi:head-tail connector protein [Roseococcus sp. SDR]|uniref:portal protein n=1 Tax=Roseococcus sp. SDR TaxID=2835532 RepID=UPI001BD0CA41|nr:portal protein [Roseococcus sp. SDR]MBS7788795.1 head-tail connector protein [Roseococcus sp. SDR]MBV1844109.1 head-tail connector protein [Roseococcus sp. SDR]